MVNNKLKALTLVFSMFFVRANSLNLRVVNKINNKDLTIFLSNSKSLTLIPRRFEDIKNFNSMNLSYGLAKANSIAIPMRLGLVPIKDALKNPYPGGISEIEVTKNLVTGIGFETFLVDSQGIMRINPRHTYEWNKILGLSRGASDGEVLYKAGYLIGLRFKEKFRLASSIRGMSEKQISKLYARLEATWAKSNEKVWKKISSAYYKIISEDIV